MYRLRVASPRLYGKSYEIFLSEVAQTITETLPHERDRRQFTNDLEKSIKRRIAKNPQLAAPQRRMVQKATIILNQTLHHPKRSDDLP